MATAVAPLQSAFTRLEPSTATSNAAWTAALQATANSTAAAPGAVHMTNAGIEASPATAALHNLQQQARLAAAGSTGAQSPAAPIATKPTWYRSQWFIQPVTAVGVFLLCFILLIAIRPPFLYKKPQPDAAGNIIDEEPVFSTGGAAVFALCAMLVAVICMVVFAVIQRKNQKPKANFNFAQQP